MFIVFNFYVFSANSLLVSCLNSIYTLFFTCIEIFLDTVKPQFEVALGSSGFEHWIDEDLKNEGNLTQGLLTWGPWN